MFKAGFQFAPGFRIQKFLGRGQFGQVWQVAAPGGTTAAVKFIDLTAGDGQKEYEGVKRVKQIRQANLMPITAIWKLDENGKAIDELTDQTVETQDLIAFDPNAPKPTTLATDASIFVKEDASWLAVAMLLGGNSLAQQLQQRAETGQLGLEVDKLISYMQDAAKGLDFLNQRQHDLGNGLVAIQHCDVKPSNIVTIGNSAVICDFGLAKILNRNQATATHASGTPHYMAPEAITGEPSLNSDQYSLAITYYHLRTGTLPASGATVWEVLDKHRNGQLNFDQVEANEREILQKATEVEWSKRYGSCAEMVDALRDAIRGVSPTTRASVQALEETQKLDLDGLSSNGSLDLSANQKIPRRSSRRTIIAGVVLAAAGMVAIGLLAIGIATGERSASSSSSHNQLDFGRQSSSDSAQLADQLLQSALSELSHNERVAAEQFEQAAKSDTGLLQPVPLTLAEDSPVIKAMFGRSRKAAQNERDVLVTIGLGSTPSAYPLPTIGVDGVSVDMGDLNPFQLAKKDGPFEAVAVAVSPDGRDLLFAGVSPLMLVPLSLSKADQVPALILSETSRETLAVVWHPRDLIIVGANDNGDLQIFELEPDNKDRSRTIKGQQAIPTTWTTRSLTIDSSGQWLAVVTQDGDIRVSKWTDVIAALNIQQELKTRSIKSPGTEARVIEFAIIDDQLCIVAGGSDGEVTLWNVSDAEKEPKNNGRVNAHEHAVESLHVAQSDNATLIITSGSDGSVTVWRPGAPHAEPVSRSFGKDPIATTAVTADGRWIALGSLGGQVWLWNWYSNPDKPLQVWNARSAVEHVTFDPDENFLFVSGDDSSIRVWNLRHLKLLALSNSTIRIDAEETELEKSREVASVR